MGSGASLSETNQAESGDRLLGLIGDTAELVEIDDFRRSLLHALHRAVPSDWISINDVGPDPDTIWWIVAPEMDLTPEQQSVFPRYAHQNPLVQYVEETRDGRPLRFSDVISQEELHSREIYKQFYGLVGIEHQIAFMLPHTGGRILGVALSRKECDYADAERNLLDTARPFLIQAYRNSIRYSELIDADAGRAAPPSAPRHRRLMDLGLTSRQAEVLRLLALGLTEQDIATRLAISPRTVQKHLERCYRKLDVNSRSRATAIAWSTIDSPPD